MDMDYRIPREIHQENGLALNGEYVKDQIRGSLFLKTSRSGLIITANNFDSIIFRLSKQMEKNYVKVMMYGCCDLRGAHSVSSDLLDEFAIFPESDGKDSLCNRVKYISQEYLMRLPRCELEIDLEPDDIERLSSRNYRIKAGSDYLWNHILPEIIELDGEDEATVSWLILTGFRDFLRGLSLDSESAERIIKMEELIDNAYAAIDNIVIIFEEQKGLKINPS